MTCIRIHIFIRFRVRIRSRSLYWYIQEGDVPMHFAAWKGQTDIVRLFLHHGVDIDIIGGPVSLIVSLFVELLFILIRLLSFPSTTARAYITLLSMAICKLYNFFWKRKRICFYELRWWYVYRATVHKICVHVQHRHVFIDWWCAFAHIQVHMYAYAHFRCDDIFRMMVTHLYI